MAGEFALIEHLLRQTRADRASRPPILGPGDDCALVTTSSPALAWAVTTDMLVAGVHFLDSDNPRDIGWKTLAVNLSDLAAMGAVPRYVTLAAAIHPEDAANTTWIEEFFAGFIDCADSHGVALIGGDTTRGPRVFSITAMGEIVADRALCRSGARPGDDIWVSGEPGYAALGLRAKLDGLVLPADVAVKANVALHHPTPRVALGHALIDLAHSAIDISDGLLQDLGHIARASKLDAILLEQALPPGPIGIDTDLWRNCQLGGGDDYELLFTAPAAVRCDIKALSNSLLLPLTRIGYMQRNTEAGKMTNHNVQMLDASHKPLDLSRHRAGFDHFA